MNGLMNSVSGGRGDPPVTTCRGAGGGTPSLSIFCYKYQDKLISLDCMGMFLYKTLKKQDLSFHSDRRIDVKGEPSFVINKCALVKFMNL